MRSNQRDVNAQMVIHNRRLEMLRKGGRNLEDMSGAHDGRDTVLQKVSFICDEHWLLLHDAILLGKKVCLLLCLQKLEGTSQ